MKYYIEFLEYPERLNLDEALKWIAYREAPYNWSAINKKGKTVKISYNKAVKSKESIEIARHELYSYIKQGKINVFGTKFQEISVKNNKNWKDFTEWDFGNLCEEIILKGGGYELHPLPWEKLKTWKDVIKHQNFFGDSIINPLEKELIDYRFIEWDFWFATLNISVDLLFTQTGMFCSTEVNFEDLLKLYPEHQIAYSIKADVINNYCIYNDEAGLVNNTGRKSFAWDTFHTQVGYIIATKGLPQQQKALVIDMEEWAKEKWGYSPSMSAIKEKLKPYYDLIKPKNKK